MKRILFLILIILLFVCACSKTSNESSSSYNPSSNSINDSSANISNANKLLRLNEENANVVVNLDKYDFDKPGRLLLSPDKSAVILKYSYSENNSKKPLPLIIDLNSGEKIQLKLGANAWADSGLVMTSWQEEAKIGSVSNYGVLVYDPKQPENIVWKVSLVNDKYLRNDKNDPPVQQQIIGMQYNSNDSNYIVLIANYYKDQPRNGLISIVIFDKTGDFKKVIHTLKRPFLNNNTQLPVEQDLSFDIHGNMAFTAAGEKDGTAQDYIINLNSERFVNTNNITFIRMFDDGFFGLTYEESNDKQGPEFKISKYKLENNNIRREAQILASSELSSNMFILPDRMQSFYFNHNGDSFIVTNRIENSSLGELEIYYKKANENIIKIYNLPKENLVYSFAAAGPDKTGALIIVG